MRIVAHAVRLPLEHPVAAGLTPLASRDYLCVEITASDGTTGIGFSYVGTRGAESALAVVREMLWPSLEEFPGSADDPRSCTRFLNDATRIQGRSGLVLNSVSAVDIALWDAAARRRNVSLAALLGASAKCVKVYASGGYYRSQNGLAELDSELDHWRSKGFDRIKLKVKGSHLTTEIERLQMARSAIGDSGLLMLDFYHAYGSNREDALDFAVRADALQPYWLEDPFAADDLDSFAWLARRTGARLATGEFQSNPVVFDHIGLIGAASVIQAEAPRCGGVTGWLEIARRTDRFGMQMSPCWFHQLHMHLVPAISQSLFVEYFDGTAVFNFDLLLDDPPKALNGEMPIPGRPGLGFNFDRDRLRHASIACFEAYRR